MGRISDAEGDYSESEWDAKLVWYAMLTFKRNVLRLWYKRKKTPQRHATRCCPLIDASALSTPRRCL